MMKAELAAMKQDYDKLKHEEDTLRSQTSQQFQQQAEVHDARNKLSVCFRYGVRWGN